MIKDKEIERIIGEWQLTCSIQLDYKQFKGLKNAISKELKECKEDVLKVIKGNYKGTFTDDAGYSCWYVDDLVELIENEDIKSIIQED